jgi:beta-lactamase regulating signal transducer with metallopeptidase domain
MEQLFYNISQILGTTIIHSLWQGLLIYGALQLIFVVVLGLSAQKKHNIAMLALFSMVAWFGYTFYTEFNNFNWNPVVSNYNLSDSLTLSLYNTYAAIPVPHTTFEGYKTEFFNAIKAYLPYIAILYTAGLIINLFKLGASWNKIRLIKKALTPNLALQAQVNDISRRMGIRKAVQLNFSTRVDVPCVIGYIKPILLLPVTITTQLNADEVEAILMHELSHIQSNDYLLNVIQQVITVLLFFNPFVILINRIISTERENRCDDMVVQTTGDPLIYAQALLKLEENRHSNLKLALAATGKKYHLLTRIERIMKTNQPTGNFKHILLAVAIMAASLGSISWLNPKIKDGKVVLKRTAAKVLANNTTNQITVVSTTTSQPSAKKEKRHFTIVADDSTRLAQLVDTIKKKSTIKIVLEDEKGNKKEYASIKDLPADARKEFLNINTDLNLNLNLDSARFGDVVRNRNFRFNNDMVFKGNELNNLKFNSDFKVFNETELKNLKEMNAEFKKLNAKQLEKMKADFKKLNSKQLEKLNANVKKLNAKELERMKTLQKNSADLDKMYNSREWQKNIADITKASTDFATQFGKSGDWQKSLQELTKQSSKFSQEFINSPEWKKYQEDLMKQVQELSKMQDESSKEAREKAKEIGNKMRERSMELRTRMNLRSDLKPERTERPEKAEKPEAPEKPEAAKKAERPETPEIPSPPKQ